MKKTQLAGIFIGLFYCFSAFARGDIEDIYGWSCDSKEVTFSVVSTGCTKKSDFDVITTYEPPPPTLTLMRRNPDLCEATPHRISIKFSYSEIGLDEPPAGTHCATKFYVRNKIPLGRSPEFTKARNEHDDNLIRELLRKDDEIAEALSEALEELNQDEH